MERRRHRSRLMPAMLVMAMAVTPGIAPLVAEAGPFVVAPFVTTPPNVDGSIGFGEFSSAGFDLPNGRVSVVNDGARLYVRLNMTGDRSNDPAWGGAGGGDYFWVTFDVNRDGVITPNVDKNFTFSPSRSYMQHAFYLGPNSRTGLQAGLLGSSWAPGFGCFFADASLQITTNPFSVSCSGHRVHEFGFDLTEIGGVAGGHVRMGVRVASGGSTSFTDEVPVGFSGDFFDLATINLASSPTPALTPSAGASVGLTSTPLELTQAVQTPTNDLTLVADKPTAARIYPRVTGSSSAQPAIVYLHASRGGAPLFGSPIVTSLAAVSAPDRTQLNGIANVALPRAWLNGTVRFSARVRDGHNAVTSSSSVERTFSVRRVPTYWTLPVNTGTSASPNLVANDQISTQESATETIFPVSDINFVRRAHTELGPVNPYSTTAGIAALNRYYDNAVIGWAFSYLFTGRQPYTLPEQIYGVAPSGGGLSDPTWDVGRGMVGVGFRGTSRELTMAHEINHNLDRTGAPGTWGRHVGGCNADGPQPDWPYSNVNTNEVGFDTRLPWNQTSSERTAIPSNIPDVMSYCQSGFVPTKWISPYRWTNLLTAFPAVNQTYSLTRLYPSMIFFSGSVGSDGTGSFDRVLTAPGFKFPISRGAFAVELYGSRGELLAARPFNATFTDPEGEDRPTVHFNFQVPNPGGVARMVLRHGPDILDEIVVSDNAPEVAITSPNGGETIPQGTFTASWTGADADGDALTYSLLYSPDDGQSWFPVANDLTGTSHTIDTSIIPGGAQSRLRVIATDGFNTVYDDSDDAFSLALTPPKAQILAPEDGSVFGVDETIYLRGDGHDATGAPIAEDRVFWSVGDEMVAQGRSAELVLPVGIHTITLTVVDGNDLVTQASVTIWVGGTCADRGYAYDEDGILSGPVHGTGEPLLPPAEETIHWVNCDIIRANDL